MKLHYELTHSITQHINADAQTRKQQHKKAKWTASPVNMTLILKFCILHPFLEPYHCWLRPQILNARKVGDQVVIGVPGFPQLREARLLHSSVGSTGHRQQVPVASLRGLQFACLSVRDWRNWHPLNDPENSGIASPKRISKTKQKTMDIPRFQTNHTQNKLLLIINKQNELNFNDNLTKHEWSNWGTGLWICKCVSFWLKAWLIFTGHQLLPYPGGTSWLRFPLFTSVDSETRFEQTHFFPLRTQHLQTTWICRFQRKNKKCNHVRPFTQQKKLCQYHGVQRKKQLPEVVDIWEPHIGREGDDLLGQRLSPCSWSRTNRRSTSTLDVSSFDMFRDFGDIKQGNLEKIWMTSLLSCDATGNRMQSCWNWDPNCWRVPCSKLMGLQTLWKNVKLHPQGL